MRPPTHVELSRPAVSDPVPPREALPAWSWIALLPVLRRDGRDIVLLVAEEPLRGALVALAQAVGVDAYACATPHDVVETLVALGDRIACAVVSRGAGWGEGLREFLADRYPEIVGVEA